MSHDHTEEKERYNRLSRRAEKQGLHLEQIQDEDPSSENYGKYTLRNIQTGAGGNQESIGGNSDYGMDLRQVEDYLDLQD